MADEKIISLRDAEVRLLDGTSNTPAYCRIHFIDGTLTVPGRRPRAAEELILNQGKADSLILYQIQSDADIFNPVPFSINALIHADKTLLDTLKALNNPDDAGSWQPGGTTTFAPVTSIGATDNADGTSVSHPLPEDAHRRAYLLDMDILLDSDTTDHSVYWKGIYFETFNYELQLGPSTLNCEGRIFGSVTRGTAFQTPVVEIS